MAKLPPSKTVRGPRRVNQRPTKIPAAPVIKECTATVPATTPVGQP
jgi:hypothetical protein